MACPTCPSSGAYLCAHCLALLARAEGTPGQVAFSQSLTEKQLQAQVREVCKALGLLHYHTYNSRKSEAGFPDSAILHPTGGTLWLCELKREGETPTIPQQTWLSALGQVLRVESGVVYPSTLEAWAARWRAYEGS